MCLKCAHDGLTSGRQGPAGSRVRPRLAVRCLTLGGRRHLVVLPSAAAGGSSQLRPRRRTRGSYPDRRRFVSPIVRVTRDESQQPMTDEDAMSFLVEHLREPTRAKRQGGRVDLDIRDVAFAFMVRHEGTRQDYRHNHGTQAAIQKRTPPFGNAAWQLARLGVLRPGEREAGDSGCPNGLYTLTDYGRAWLARPCNELVFVSPDRSAQLLGRYRERFGDAFLQRGIEAGHCYRAGHYLACVAMCGAAREAILVRLALEHFSPDVVEKEYRSSGGRGRLETRVVGQLNQSVRREFREQSSALDFWRDYAAHGLPAPVGEPEAFRALRLLLRLAQFVDSDVPRGKPTR